jgi:hypothetical protein
MVVRPKPAGFLRPIADLMMNQEITLNIRYDIPEGEWKAVSDIYSSMDGWLAGCRRPTTVVWH